MGYQSLPILLVCAKTLLCKFHRLKQDFLCTGSLSQCRTQKIGNLVSNLRAIIDTYVADYLDDSKLCSIQCKHSQFSHLMIQLHQRNMYPSLPIPPYHGCTYNEIKVAFESSMETDETVFTCPVRGSTLEGCSMEWACRQLAKMPDDLHYSLRELLPGWKTKELKTWVLYRKLWHLKMDEWIEQARK